MTKVPRDLTGRKLCDRLPRVGYHFKRAAGDHFIMANEAGTRTISVPQHKPLKIGTLSDILSDLEADLGLSRAELRSRLGI